jgi:hypothetical protein
LSASDSSALRTFGNQQKVAQLDGAERSGTQGRRAMETGAGKKAGEENRLTAPAYHAVLIVPRRASLVK